MRVSRLLMWCAAGVYLCGTSLFAGAVTIEGSHLCCGACVKAVNEALTGVEGVSNVKVDKDAGTISYDATDAKLARGGLTALAKAGFGGAAKHDGKEMKFPKGYKEDGKANEVKIGGVHNCCPGCAKAIEGALKGVTGVETVTCNKRTCTVTGKDLAYSALIEALHAEGLHGNIAMEKKAE